MQRVLQEMSSQLDVLVQRYHAVMELNRTELDPSAALVYDCDHAPLIARLEEMIQAKEDSIR